MHSLTVHMILPFEVIIDCWYQAAELVSSIMFCTRWFLMFRIEIMEWFLKTRKSVVPGREQI